MGRKGSYGKNKWVSLGKPNRLLWEVRSLVIMFVYVSALVFFKAMKLPGGGYMVVSIAEVSDFR